VTWTERGFPGWRFQKTMDTPLTLGGHRARMQVQHPGFCSAIGGVESVSVVVEMPALPDNYWRIDACIRGPDVATADGQVRAMLQTAQFPSD
jgi:hypothetical protein